MATLVQNTDRIKGGAEEIKKILLAEGKTPGLIETFAPLLAESIVGTPTEQNINGTRTTASGASIDKGIAVLKGLRGKAVKVVQLVNATGTEYAGITITRNENGSVSFEGTNATGSTQVIRFCSFEQSLNRVSHKVLAYANLQGGIDEPQYWSQVSTYGILMQIQGSGWELCFGKQPLIGTTSDSGYYALSLVIADGQTINETVFPMVFDLTAMGLENCNTADEVARALGYASIADVPYIPYTEGEILVSKPSRLISKDADGDVLDSLAITLPSLFADGILSVGDVADEWGTKATKRVGMVDLGNLNWRYSHYITNVWSVVGAIETTNFVSATYNKTDWQQTPPVNSIMAVVDGGNVVLAVYNGSSTEKPSGKLLYELATPIEEQTPLPVGFYKAEPNGTEEVQDAESIPTLLDGFIGYEGMDTIANLASAWGIDINKVGKVIVTGTENWQLADSGYYAGLFVIRIDALPVRSAGGRGSAIPYKGWNNANPTGMPDGYIIGPSGYYSSTFFTSGIRDSRFASLDAWKAHLADLYASGCPLTIYYEKA